MSGVFKSTSAVPSGGVITACEGLPGLSLRQLRQDYVCQDRLTAMFGHGDGHLAHVAPGTTAS